MTEPWEKEAQQDNFIDRIDRARDKAKEQILEESKVPTPYAVFCDALTVEGTCTPADCGFRFLTKRSYESQKNSGGVHWTCPRCGGKAVLDEENLEEWGEKL